jgi:methylenetetrahydrofolate reductase (NADPH)
VTAPLRVGVAGPASTTKLIKYAMRCGVGASLRTLTERKGIAGTLLGGETPEAVLDRIAAAAAEDPSLAIGSVHFFTFGAPAKSVEWAEQHLA